MAREVGAANAGVPFTFKTPSGILVAFAPMLVHIAGTLELLNRIAIRAACMP